MLSDMIVIINSQIDALSWSRGPVVDNAAIAFCHILPHPQAPDPPEDPEGCDHLRLRNPLVRRARNLQCGSALRSGVGAIGDDLEVAYERREIPQHG